MESIEKPSSTSSESTKCKCEKGSEIVDVICEIHSSCMQVELSKHKLYLIQQQEARKSNEDQWKEKEDACKEKKKSAGPESTSSRNNGK